MILVIRMILVIIGMIPPGISLTIHLAPKEE
jgi:hypothetical protein